MNSICVGFIANWTAIAWDWSPVDSRSPLLRYGIRELSQWRTYETSGFDEERDSSPNRRSSTREPVELKSVCSSDRITWASCMICSSSGTSDELTIIDPGRTGGS